MTKADQWLLWGGHGGKKHGHEETVMGMLGNLRDISSSDSA